ncbi:MAG TPA: Dna2/Cas4 domain-containing protein [Ktedonobacteraceae bacterium]|jgi:CRISPR-associated exonuclease Cas4
MHIILLTIGSLLLTLAGVLGVLLWNERRSQRAYHRAQSLHELGLPEGKLVYGDADGRGEPLFSQTYPLVGKPDYVVQLADGRPVPIELKLNVQNATTPYSNHQVQVAAYCLILEDYFAQPPTHGILRYADREFTIEYTPAMRRKVIRLLGQMALCNEQEQPALARQRAAKCRVCVFQSICSVGKEK